MEFGKICDIDVENDVTWGEKIFITLDMDWCSDKVLEYTLDLLEESNTKATFFVTHDTPLLQRMRRSQNIELGIHPNFNPLLNGDFKYGKNFYEVIEYYKKLVPEAVSVRSHSMTQSSQIIDGFEKFDLIYDCNTFIPFSSNIITKPYKHWSGRVIKIPYIWEDDVHCMYGWDWDIVKYLNYKGLKVFDFHPIHIFLNTEKIDRYNKARPYLQANKKIKEHVNDETFGIKDFFIDIIINRDWPMNMKLENTTNSN